MQPHLRNPTCEWCRNRQRTPLEFLDDASRLDPYAVLGIPFLSGRRAIRQAYANCCREHHPDLNGGRESLEWMMIQRAYRILTDPEERVYYDSARIARNALSVTEGVAAFAWAAAQQMGAVVSDAAEAAQAAAQRLGGFGRFLQAESQAWAERGSKQFGFTAFVAEKGPESLEDAKEDWKKKRARVRKSLEELREARQRLEDFQERSGLDSQ
ncbi:unnamed protein product [Effrenium voratum]|nr:unnamed protein product [Effrenium voratum]